MRHQIGLPFQVAVKTKSIQRDEISCILGIIPICKVRLIDYICFWALGARKFISALDDNIKLLV